MNSAPSHRRAGVYVLVLGCGLMITLIGTTAVLGIRQRQRAVSTENDAAAARCLAQSAIEYGMQTIATTSDWRKTLPNGEWYSKLALGNGSFTLQGLDTGDGNLADSKADAVTLVGIGAAGEAEYRQQVTLVPPIQPLEALNTCLHAGGNLVTWYSASVTASGAPLSANGTFRHYGYVSGNVECKTAQLYATVWGSVKTGVAPKDAPVPEVVGQYVTRATARTYGGSISALVLGPGCNPGGLPNANGIYLIDSGGQDFTIQNTRVIGTLIVRTRGGTVRIGPRVNLAAFRSDAPALIVDGNAEFILSSGSSLREPDFGVNFNPNGAPYNGRSDSDASDSYPSSITGLVHVTGSLAVTSSTTVTGTVLVEGDVGINASMSLTFNPDLYAKPPQDYVGYGTPQPAAGSWRQVLAP